MSILKTNNPKCDEDYNIIDKNKSKPWINSKKGLKMNIKKKNLNQTAQKGIGQRIQVNIQQKKHINTIM